MKFSAILLAAFAAATPASAAPSAWPPVVSPATLGAIAVPAPGNPVRALPKDGVNYSAAEEILIKEFGMTGISLDIPEAQVGAQMQNSPSSLCFEQALRSALFSFLTDYSDSTSPLAVILSGMGIEKPTKSELKLASKKLAQQMNMPGASLYLVRDNGPHQPSRGEKVRGNWIFNLRLNNYSNSYWAIADRSGSNAAYNYGSN